MSRRDSAYVLSRSLTATRYSGDSHTAGGQPRWSQTRREGEERFSVGAGVVRMLIRFLEGRIATPESA